jgi:hypothetical protein
VAEGIGISLYVSDNATAGLTKVNQGLLRLKKQAEDTDGKLSELAKRKMQLTVDTERAKKALQEAKRAFDDTDEQNGWRMLAQNTTGCSVSCAVSPEKRGAPKVISRS